MDLDNWIKSNYLELRKITSSISKLNDIDDLFQFCILQLLENKKVMEVPDKEKLFFYSRIVRNNFYSKSSPYYRTYNKLKLNEFNIQTEPYDLQPENNQVIDFKWVEKEIKKLKKTEWYYARLFELYIESECSISKLSQRTTIPINSVSRDINRVRRHLNKQRNNLL
jgi:DNA-directed RNA polymerase specialized sigma24 family protein